MSEYLQTTYKTMGQSLVVPDNYFEWDSRFYSLEAELISRPKGVVLDLGCGQGTLLKRLSAVHRVYGLEYDSGAREIARSHGLMVEPVDLNTASELPYPGPFDYIVCSEVCEHLLDPRNVFRIARATLAERGLFIVTVPNAVPLFVRWRLLWGRTCDWLHYPSPDTEITGHIRFYTLPSLQRLAHEEGFEVISRRGLGWRMNGNFWVRLLYWMARLSGRDATWKRAMLMDRAIGKWFPDLSPGLMLVLRKKAPGFQASST